MVDSDSIETVDPLTLPYGIKFYNFTGLGIFNHFSSGSIFAVDSGVSDCSDPAAIKTEACGSAAYTTTIKLSLYNNVLNVVGEYATGQICYVYEQTLGNAFDIISSPKYLVVAAYSDVGNSDQILVNEVLVNYPNIACSPACTLPKMCIANTCQCSDGWSGVSCEIPSCIQACQNGGSCSYPNFCQCTDSWGGFDCTKSEFFLSLILLDFLRLFYFSVKCLYLREINADVGVLPAIATPVEHLYDNSNCSWLITVSPGYAIEFVIFFLKDCFTTQID